MVWISTPGISGLQHSDGQVSPRFLSTGMYICLTGRNQKRYDQYNQTHVINAYNHYIDYEDDNLREHLKR